MALFHIFKLNVRSGACKAEKLCDSTGKFVSTLAAIAGLSVAPNVIFPQVGFQEHD